MINLFILFLASAILTTRKFIPLHKKKYKVIIFEEFQIGANAQDWYNKLSKLLNMLLSTFRHQNFILLINAPFSDMINSQAKRLFHMEIEMRSKNERKGISKIRPKILQWSVRKKDFYQHSLYVIQNGQSIKTPFYTIGKPPEWLWKRYEELKSNFTYALNRRIECELEDYEKENLPESMKEKNPETDLNPRSKQLAIWNEAQKGYDNLIELASRVEKVIGSNVPWQNVSRNSISMRKKGYDIRKFRKTGNFKS